MAICMKTRRRTKKTEHIMFIPLFHPPEARRCTRWAPRALPAGHRHRPLDDRFFPPWLLAKA